MFSVKSTYDLLEGIFVLENDLGELEKMVFGGLWKSLAPSKEWLSLGKCSYIDFQPGIICGKGMLLLPKVSFVGMMRNLLSTFFFIVILLLKCGIRF